MNYIMFVLFVIKSAVKAIVLGYNKNNKVKVSITVDGQEV
jgi:hypothetical protein